MQLRKYSSYYRGKVIFLFIIYYGFVKFLPKITESKDSPNMICPNIIGLSTLLKFSGQCSTFPGTYTHVVLVMMCVSASLPSPIVNSTSASNSLKFIEAEVE